MLLMAKIPRYESNVEWRPAKAPMVPLSIADTGLDKAFATASQAAFGVAEKEKKAQDKLDYDNFQTDYTRDLEQAKVDALDKKPSERSDYVMNRSLSIKNSALNKYADGRSSLDAWNSMNSYADHHGMLAVAKTKYDARIDLSKQLEANSNLRFDNITLQAATTNVSPDGSLSSWRLEDQTSRGSIEGVVMDADSYQIHIASKRRALAGIHHSRIFSKGIKGLTTGDPIIHSASDIRAALQGTLDIAARVKAGYPNKSKKEIEDLTKFYNEVLTTTAGGVKDRQTILNAFDKAVLSESTSKRTAAEREAHAKGTDWIIEIQRDMNLVLQNREPGRSVDLERLNEFNVLAKSMGKSGDRKMAFVNKLWSDFRKPRQATAEEMQLFHEIKLHVLEHMQNSPAHKVMDYIMSQVYPDTESREPNGQFKLPSELYLKLLEDLPTNASGTGGISPLFDPAGLGPANKIIQGWVPSLMGVLEGEMRYKLGDKGKEHLKAAADADLYYGMKSYIEKFVAEQSYAKNPMEYGEAENHIRQLVRGKELGDFTKDLQAGAVMTVPVDQLNKLFEMHESGEDLTPAQLQLLHITSTRITQRMRNFGLDVKMKGLISNQLKKSLIQKERHLEATLARLRASGKSDAEIRVNKSYLRAGLVRTIVSDLKAQAQMDPYDLRLFKELLKEGKDSLRERMLRYSEAQYKAVDVTQAPELRTVSKPPPLKPVPRLPSGEMKQPPGEPSSSSSKKDETQSWGDRLLEVSNKRFEVWKERNAINSKLRDDAISSGGYYSLSAKERRAKMDELDKMYPIATDLMDILKQEYPDPKKE